MQVPDIDTLHRILALQPDSGVARVALEALSAVSGIPMPAVQPVHVVYRKRGGEGLAAIDRLRDRLLDGPVHRSEWPDFSTTQGYFRQMIHYLRRSGMRIDRHKGVYRLNYSDD